MLVLSTIVTLNSWSEEGSAPHYHIKPAAEIQPPDSVELPPTPLPPDNELPILKEEDDNHNEALQDGKDVKNEEVKVKPPIDQEAVADKFINVNPVIDSPEEVKKVPPMDQAAANVNPVIDSPEDAKPVAMENKEGADIHGKLEQLAERVDKLEEENKDLKERQAEIENKDHEAPDVQAPGPVEFQVKDDTPRQLIKRGGEGVNKPLLDEDGPKEKKVDRVIEDADDVPKPRENVLKIDSPLKDIPNKVAPLKNMPAEEKEANSREKKVNPAPVQPAVNAAPKVKLPAPVVDPDDVDVDKAVANRDLNLDAGVKKEEKHFAGARDLKNTWRVEGKKKKSFLESLFITLAIWFLCTF